MPDPITESLRAAQKPLERYLWVPADAITFTPHVLSKTYGDGRALFGVGTINSRPAFWIVRGDSSWTSGMDYGEDAPEGAPDFGDIWDEIICDLEEEFGRAECGTDYEWDGDTIVEWSDGAPTGDTLTEADISFPTVNYGGGGHWFRLDWPDLEGLGFTPHPLHPRVRLLAK